MNERPMLKNGAGWNANAYMADSCSVPFLSLSYFQYLLSVLFAAISLYSQLASFMLPSFRKWLDSCLCDSWERTNLFTIVLYAPSSSPPLPFHAIPCVLGCLLAVFFFLFGWLILCAKDVFPTSEPLFGLLSS